MKAFFSKKILLSDRFFSGFVLVEEDIIIDIVEELPKKFDGLVFDFGTDVLAPSLVDTHVHINEPGRTEWEGFLTATSAAAAGGITTVMDMPLNCLPVTTSKDALEVKVNEIAGKLFVDVGFWGGVVPESIGQLEELLGAGVFGVKSFLIDSGIEEFPEMKKSDLEKAMPIISKFKRPYLIHAELDDDTLEQSETTDDYQAFLNSRPKSFENKAIDLMIELSEKYQCPVHIVHLSSADALINLKIAKEKKGLITVETCPHYLIFESEEISSQKGTLYKCCPPIREKTNKKELWKGLKEGIIDFIVSDHSPCSPKLKCLDDDNLEKAWGGISSLQFGLPLIWTEMKLQGMTLHDLFSLMSTRTAEFIGLGQTHGKIEKGYQANFVVFDPDQKLTIERHDILHKHKETPYLGREIYGKIKQTILSGKTIYKDGEVIGAPTGKAIFRKN